MEIFNVIAGVCSILGLFISLFTLGKVIKISQNFNINNQDDHSKTKTVRNIKNLSVGEDYIEGDKINAGHK